MKGYEMLAEERDRPTHGKQYWVKWEGGRQGDVGDGRAGQQRIGMRVIMLSG